MQKKNIIYSTTSDGETIRLGKAVGSVLFPGDVLGVVGTLGSGKTWFAKGVGLGLGVPPETVITSPSFALVNEYEGRVPFFHMDLYRLRGLEDFLAAGLEEVISEDGVALVEWAERCPQALPEQTVWVSFAIEGENERRIEISGSHPRALEILKALPENLSD